MFYMLQYIFVFQQVQIMATTNLRSNYENYKSTCDNLILNENRINTTTEFSENTVAYM